MFVCVSGKVCEKNVVVSVNIHLPHTWADGKFRVSISQFVSLVW